MQDETIKFLNADGSINYNRALEAGRVERSNAALSLLRRLSGGLVLLQHGVFRTKAPRTI